MALRPAQVNIKAVDHAAVARFWAEALSWSVLHEGETTYVGPPGTFTWPDPLMLGIDVVPVPAYKTKAKNRVHLDLAHRPGLVAHVQSLGATILRDDLPWTVLADPEGNEFCVLEPRDIYQDTGPIAAVVVDSTNPAAMARFWREAINWLPHESTDDAAVFRSPEGTGPYLEFLRVPNATTPSDRVHLDLLPNPHDSKEAEATRLRSLGATNRDINQGNVPWTCLTDPEGHDFCILAPS